jgi:hypothetical protein
VKLLKFFVALLLLPAAAALTVTVWNLARALAFSRTALPGQLGLAFCAGYAAWLLVFVFLPKPMRTYVLAHELTHAVWALLMGARVSDLRVSKSGGQVKTSKTNWVITLAPYFFPFYAMLFIALFYIAHAIWGLERYMAVLFSLVGLGWSFHVTFTLMMLMTVQQPDVKSQGFLFSMVVIYSMNLLTIALTTALLSPVVTLAALAKSIGASCVITYGWTLDKLVALWQHGAVLLRRRR